MGLKVISLMKQVPLPTEMRMGSDGLMDRTKAKSIINIDCSFGLEQGLQIKKSVPDAELIVVSMGPPSFEQSLRKAISMGYDRVVLLSDRRLGGSDTFATGLAIATLLKTLILPKNKEDRFIIFAGRQTSDGDTAHVPSQVAENLGIPQVTFVEHVEYCESYLKVRRMIEGGHQTLKVPIPCIISVAPTSIPARRPSLSGSIQSRQAQIETYTLDHISLNPEAVGLAGSPTVVAKAVNIEHTRPPVTMLSGKNFEETSSKLVRIFDEPAKPVSASAKKAPAAGPPASAESTEAASSKPPRVDFRQGASGILTWIEVPGGVIAQSSLELLNPARKLADQLNTTITSVLIGENVTALAPQVIAHGADEVIVVNHPRLKEYLILPFASVIEQVAKERRPEIALFGATTSGRELAPRLASRLRAGVTADCTILKIGEFVNKRLKSTFYPCLEAIRPTYGESKLATIIGFWCPQMATARPGTFALLPPDPNRKGKITEFHPQLHEKDFVVEILQTDRKEVGGQSLFSAEIIISGGRPCGELDDFKLIKDLVQALQEQGIKADWGASRQAVDHGYAPYSRQVGQTGKTVRPKVYVAVAISGAIQHTCGIKDSGKIIAINTDAQSSIFNSSDYGIVGDYLQVVPALIEKVKSGFTFGLKAAHKQRLIPA
ncbi:MAG: electron transfer flavoprotein subunit alpha [Omnitrophica WOR_2 bacterium RIFCSPHIGHO2_01_FULL_48_9]|nr:MAG: electron transfer flavoprotein subunit alpha [Omnitrophica WOR_2 bacterium RIFCSPHIGHO2_01_FULL_48_9]